MTNYKKILVSAAASAMIISSLNASKIEIKADNNDSSAVVGGAFTVPQYANAELQNADKNITIEEPQDGTTTTGVAQVVYTPTANIPQNSKVTLTVTNGAIADGTTLYFKKDLNATTQLNFVSGVKNAANTGYTQIVFIAADDIPANTSLVLSKANSPLTEPVIIAAKGTPADHNVTIAITDVRNDDSQQTQNPGAIPDGYANAAQIVKAFTKTVKEAATSVISVENGRKNFTSEGASSDTPDENTSLYSFISLVDTRSLINNLTLTVKNSVAPCNEIAAVKVKGTNVGTVASTDANTTTCTFKFTADNTSNLYKDINSTSGIEIEIDVNGTGTIDPSNWTTTLDINGSVIGQINGEINAVTHKWTLDGSQFVVPYLNTNLAYGTYVLMTNTSAKDAGVTIEVYADKGANEGMSQATRICSDKEITLTTLPANSTRIYLPAEINDAIEAKCAGFKAGNQRYMGKFTVEAPTGTVIPTAFQRDAATGGKRAVPVYKETEVATNKKGWRE